VSDDPPHPHCLGFQPKNWTLLSFSDLRAGARLMTSLAECTSPAALACKTQSLSQPLHSCGQPAPSHSDWMTLQGAPGSGWCSRSVWRPPCSPLAGWRCRRQRAWLPSLRVLTRTCQHSGTLPSKCSLSWRSRRRRRRLNRRATSHTLHCQVRPLSSCCLVPVQVHDMDCRALHDAHDTDHLPWLTRQCCYCLVAAVTMGLTPSSAHDI